MNLVPLLDSALAADLNKSEWRAFAALLRQTLGFNKISDALTFGRLAQLTGLRKDHAKAAVQGVLKAGLFSQSEHPNYEFMYTVAHAECVETRRESKPDQEKPAEPKQPDLLTYPEEIDDETKQGLRQPLSTLPKEHAQRVVDRLAQAIRNTGEVKKTPVAMGKWLITEVKSGNFSVFTPKPTDSTIRFSSQQPTQTPSAQPKPTPPLNKSIDDEFFYRNLARHEGISVEQAKANFLNAHKKATVSPVALSNY